MKIMNHQKPLITTPVAWSPSVSLSLRLRSLLFAVLAIVFGGHLASAQLANGDFELGNLSNWAPPQSSAPGSINWFNYTGTVPPISAGPGYDTVQAPPQGSRAAIAASNYLGWAILYRDIYLAPGQSHTLKMQVYYTNYWVGEPGTGTGPADQDKWITPASLTSTAYPSRNQQYRVDVVTTTAALGSTAPADIIATVFKTVSLDPATLTPTSFCVDLSAYAGQTVRLRLAVAQTENVLNGFVDDVQLISTVVGSPNERARLVAVGSQLGAILGTVTNSDDRKKLTDAIKKLGEADANKLWDGANRPTQEDGKKIFDRVKDAAKKMAELQSGAKTLSLRPQMTPLINELVATSRKMATRSIDELTLAGPGSNKPADAQKKLNEALSELAKGDLDANDNDPDSAIGHYKHAWQKAADKLDDIANES